MSSLLHKVLQGHQKLKELILHNLLLPIYKFLQYPELLKFILNHTYVLKVRNKIFYVKCVFQQIKF